MILPTYYVLPHPRGGWVITKSHKRRWASYRDSLIPYPSAIAAMAAATEKPDVKSRRQIVWIAKE